MDFRLAMDCGIGIKDARECDARVNERVKFAETHGIMEMNSLMPSTSFDVIIKFKTSKAVGKIPVALGIVRMPRVS